MTRTRRLTLTVAALVVALVTLLAAPADAKESAASQRRRRDAARSARARLAAKLNELKATDAQLERAVRDLTSQVGVQRTRAAAAQQAVDAALSTARAAEAKVREAEEQMAAIHQDVVDRAVAAYVRPSTDLIEGIVGSRDLNDASRRSTVLSHVAARDRDVIDQLRVLKLDYADEQREATEAGELARSRQTLVNVRLRELREARDAKQRLETALDARIAQYQRELDEMARQEAGLAALIRRRGGTVTVDGRVSGAGMMWPVSGRVTSEFGQRWGRLHAGIDIANGTGTPIHASKGGEVIVAGQMGGYGNVIVIAHGGGLSTLYGHQSRLAAREGQDVARGSVIGYVGSTGHSTGPHLHFEVRIDGSPQNPRRYLP